MSGVERRDIYQSRFPRKFISRTFSTYAFSNAVKVGLARARARLRDIGILLRSQGQLDTRTRAFFLQFFHFVPRYFFYRPPSPPPPPSVLLQAFILEERREKKRKEKEKETKGYSRNSRRNYAVIARETTTFPHRVERE